ncbi:MULTISPECIES: phytase [Mumia]|uniref:Phytase n=1 Tax=Mumia xiangluensis TaxID=1678900 RepID=A0ABW1QK58_9ACTN|nr:MULTISPECIES: phytase [Mumia]
MARPLARLHSRRTLTASLSSAAVLGALCLAGTLPAVASPDRTPKAPLVTATVETRAVFDDEAGNNADADDPAIWVAPGNRSDSLVLGSLKNGGLDAYDLRGRLVQHVDAPAAPGEDLESSRFNNVDIATGVRITGQKRDLAIVTDRGRDRLRFYAIDGSGARYGKVLHDLTAADAPRLFSPDEAAVEEQATGYGLAVRPDPTGGLPYVVVSQRHRTTVGIFRLAVTSEGRLTYTPVDTVALPTAFPLSGGGSWVPCGEPGEDPQVEGMVVDTVSDVLYAAQEDVGVWRVPLGRTGLGKPVLVERVREFGASATYDPETEECTVTGTSPASGKHLTADAEGLTIAYARNGDRTLIASSQGDSTFSTFRIGRGWRYLDTFEVEDSAASDGVQHSDGAAVVTTPLGRDYPRGLLVTHDGENGPDVLDADGEVRASTNFKFVDLRRITLR